MIKNLLGGAAVLALLSGTASAQTLILATDRAGSTFNAIGAAVAKVVTAGSGLRVVVRPFGGPDAYLDSLERGEIQLATLSAPSTYWAVAGKNPSGKVYKNFRLLRSGAGGVRLTFLVTRNSGIKTYADLRGRKVASEYGGHAVVKTATTGGLAAGGLTWDDVQPVPVTGVVEGVRMVGEGRLDAAWAAFGMPIARQMNAKVGLHYLSFEPGPKTLAIVRDKIFPGARLATIPAKPKLGLPRATTFISFDSYFIGNRDLDAGRVRTILETLWDKTDEFVKIHRGTKGFSRKFAVTDVPLVPYHPAAIAFYKEKGVWSAAAEAANAKLLR